MELFQISNTSPHQWTFFFKHISYWPTAEFLPKFKVWFHYLTIIIRYFFYLNSKKNGGGKNFRRWHFDPMVYRASVTIMSHLTSTSSGRFHTLEDEPSASEQNYSHVLVEPKEVKQKEPEILYVYSKFIFNIVQQWLFK